MNAYVIEFLDGQKREINAFNFSCAKVIAAYQRMTDENAQTHTELGIDDRKCAFLKTEEKP